MSILLKLNYKSKVVLRKCHFFGENFMLKFICKSKEKLPKKHNGYQNWYKLQNKNSMGLAYAETKWSVEKSSSETDPHIFTYLIFGVAKCRLPEK